MVLLAAEGMPNAQIARVLGVSRPTVIGWRERYQRGGIKALEDEPRCGRPPRIDEADVVVATLACGGRPPQRLGVPHWSARLLAAELGISFASVARVWRRWGIQPGQIGTFRFACVPELQPGIRDVVAVYLGPPDPAVVVSIAETFQARAVSRATSARRGLPEWRTRNHRRHGTATLLSALEQAGARPAAAPRRPAHREFIRFLARAADAHRGVDLHVVADGPRAARQPEVRRWLARPGNQRVTVHASPDGCSWLTMAEIFFGIIGQDGMPRAAPRPGAEISAAISAFIGTYHDRPEPFTWIKNASGAD